MNAYELRKENARRHALVYGDMSGKEYTARKVDKSMLTNQPRAAGEGKYSHLKWSKNAAPRVLGRDMRPGGRNRTVATRPVYRVK